MNDDINNLTNNISESLTKLYNIGGLALVFIFVGVLTMIVGNYSNGTLSHWIFIIGAIVTLTCLSLFVYLQIQKSKENNPYVHSIWNDFETEKREIKYDLFVSSPMTSISSQKYRETRDLTIKVIEYIRNACNFETVYYAGQSIEEVKLVDPPLISAAQDFASLKASKYYLLIYPMSLVTSTLVEAGYALALGIPALYLVKDVSDLPYMLRGAAEAFSPDVRILEYTDEEDMLRLINSYSNKIFNSN